MRESPADRHFGRTIRIVDRIGGHMARTVFEKADVVPLLAEVFREFGYEGASFSRITERTRLGKGSLYHFFPGGKEQMAAEVLAEIDAWFVAHVFKPLDRDEPRAAIAAMWRTVEAYFRAGRRTCLVGAFALDDTRDRFAAPIRNYFKRWIAALRGALLRAGVEEKTAGRLATDAVAGIQGALVLARAMRDNGIFVRTLARLAGEIDDALAAAPRQAT